MIPEKLAPVQAEIDREIQSRCHVRPDGWVDMDDLTVHIPFGFIKKCGVYIAAIYDGRVIQSIVTPPSRGLALAMATAFAIDNIMIIEYPRRRLVVSNGKQNDGFVPLTVCSPFHKGKELDFLLAWQMPPGFGDFIIIDDVLRSGQTAWMLIHNIQRLWRVSCLGLVAIAEIKNAGGRERLARDFPHLPILALAQVGGSEKNG